MLNCNIFRVSFFYNMKSYIVLGLNCVGHDTSAVIGVDGNVVAACEQERFDLNKHSRNFPVDAIKECLKISKLRIDDIDEIALSAVNVDIIKKFYLKQAISSNTRIEFMLNDLDRIKKLYFLEDYIRKTLGYKKKINSYKHHLCHLSSAYYASGFKESIIFSNDGLGEIETGMLGVGNNGKINIVQRGPDYPNSLGLIYSAITHYLGWKHHSDEGIVMGLAPFGDPYSKRKKETYIDLFRDIIIKKFFYNFEINKKWISYHQQRNTWVSKYFVEIFGEPRKPYSRILKKHKDIAAALQLRLEEVVLEILKEAKIKYKLKKLCIAGGVGLNCSLNGKIEESKLFDEIFVQPASGDAGAALGAVYLAFANQNNNYLEVKQRTNHYLGSRYEKSTIKKFLIKKKIKHITSKNIYRDAAKLLKSGKILAWFQGASEFGPRALGNRSILSKPYPIKCKNFLNKNVKFREAFRPFAPAVIEEKAHIYFKINQRSPHMLIASKIKKNIKKKIPAVVHVDETARIQTVSENTNSKFYKLLKSFFELTGCPVLLNTSFNIKGQPVVNSYQQAIETFYRTKIDILILDDFILLK